MQTKEHLALAQKTKAIKIGDDVYPVYSVKTLGENVIVKCEDPGQAHHFIEYCVNYLLKMKALFLESPQATKSPSI